MSNFHGFLMGFLFFLPFVVGTVCLYVIPNLRIKLFILLICILIIGTSLAFFLGEVDIKTSLFFLGEMISFNISFTALIIYQISMLILLGLVIVDSSKEGDFLTGSQSILFSSVLSFGFIAFISGQFMIRYIALDLVGLIAALIVIQSFDDRIGFGRFSAIFAFLRFGDLCLLASILLLYDHAGTIDISQMIQVAVDLPSGVQIWVFGGFFIAVMIKTATWPFSLWMHHAHQGTKDIRFWISTVLMPGLGYYLLYRIQPMIVNNGIFKSGLLYFSVGLLLLTILVDIIYHKKFAPFMDIGGLFGLFIFVASAYGPKDQLKFLIPGVLIYRCLLFLKDNLSSPVFRKLLTFFPLLVNAFYISVNLKNFSPLFVLGWSFFTILFISWRYWREVYQINEGSKFTVIEVLRIEDSYPGGFVHKGAQWLNQNVEIGLFTDGVYRLSGLFKKLAVWLNEKVERDILTGGFYWLSDSLVHSADWISERVEQGLERLYSWIGKNLMAISEGALFKLEVESAQKSEEFFENSLNSLKKYEQNVLKKNLRLDIAWIPLFLILILVLILVV